MKGPRRGRDPWGAGGEVDAVEQAQLRMDRGKAPREQLGRLEEDLRDHGEELRRVFGGIRVDVGVDPAIDLGAEVLVGAGEGLGPGLARHARAQAGQAVDAAVLHVELVREFVDDHVYAGWAVLLVEPCDQHRSALPGLAEHLVVVLVEYAGLIDGAAGNHEVAGIDDDPDPAVVGLKPDVEDGQTGLQRDREQHVVVELQALRTVELLAAQEFERHLAQPQALVGQQAGEEGQGALDPLPLFGGYCGCGGREAQEAADEA